MNKRAIIHVENTEGVIEFSKFLSELGWTILTANKTEELLKRERIPVINEPSLVENNIYQNDLTNLLQQISNTKYYNSFEEENSELSENENGNIFVICMNVSPFINIETVNSISQIQKLIKSASFFISKIIRSAFENSENILLLTSPEDYKEAMIQIRTNNITEEFRSKLAGKALNLISAYDSGLSASLLMQENSQKFMNYMMIPFKKQQEFIYGANRQQAACLYKFPTETGIMSGLKKINEKDLTYNIVVDVAFAWEIVSTIHQNLKNQFSVGSTTCDNYDYITQFTPQTGTVFTIAVKYKSIIGASLAPNVADSFRQTCSYDFSSIENTIVASSAVIDKDAAQVMVNQSISVIVAPGFTTEAKEVLSANKNILLIPTTSVSISRFDMDLFSGGILFQTKDLSVFDHWYIKTKIRPTQEICDQMLFGMDLATNIKTHGAILLRRNSIIGIVQGEKSTKKALKNVYEDAIEFWERNKDFSLFQFTEGKQKPDALICDTPIPFGEEIKQLIYRGVSSIIEPGGHPTDDELIQFCNENNVILIFTKMTHITY